MASFGLHGEPVAFSGLLFPSFTISIITYLMRVVFMGNPGFSLPALQAVHTCWGDPVGVYTAPDRRRGRGLAKGFSDIKAYSLEKCWPIFQPSSLKRGSAVQEFIDLQPDLVVVAAYGLLIPTEMLSVPKHGFLNIHPSLLPKYRGPSPVPSVILDGVEETGVSIMLLDEGFDTGPVLAREATKILPGEKADALAERLFKMGARLLVKSVPRWTGGCISPQPQDPDVATYTAKLSREDGRVDWTESATMLSRRFRAYTPWPGLYTSWRGNRLRLLDVEELSTSVEKPQPDNPAPGVVAVHSEATDAIAIQAGGGTTLLVRRLQMEGRRAQGAGEFLLGYPQIIGERLPS